MEAKQSRLESVLLELRPCNWKELPWAMHVVLQPFPFQIPPLKDTAPERRESKWALGGYVQSCSVAIERAVGIQAAEPTGDTKLGTARCHRCQVSVMSKGSWDRYQYIDTVARPKKTNATSSNGMLCSQF